MKEMLTVSEVAQILKLSDLTIRRYLKENKLNGFKVGREWRIVKGELDNFIRGEEC